MKNIKAIVFDLNGVFITSPKLSHRFHQDFGVDEEAFLLALKDVMAQVRQPHAGGAYSYWQPYLEQWGVPFDEESLLDYWFAAEKENPAMIKISEALKAKGISLFILSNNLRERSGYYQERFSFLGALFQKIYYSWQTGFIKPDRRAYELILRENNLRPEECIYFDDSQTNIAVAQGIGIESYLFQGSDDVQEKLAELLTCRIS
ncbi:MAG: HAD family phosphatase [Candidatus Moraniibacteriota bacterium]